MKNFFISHWSQKSEGRSREVPVPRDPPQPTRAGSQHGNRPGWPAWDVGLGQPTCKSHRYCLLRIVCLLMSQNQIGVVEGLYDKPSEHLPYPRGYSHDLALIYGPDLPEICRPSPLNVNMLPEWVPYEEALKVCQSSLHQSMRMQYSSWGTLEGKVASKATEKALVKGMDYHWDKTTKTSSAGLIWRTADGSLFAKGWSGSVLCLGQRSRRPHHRFSKLSAHVPGFTKR